MVGRSVRATRRLQPRSRDSATRTETFWPCFLGLEQLLRDKVEARTGVLSVEEAARVGSGRTHSRGGLEAAADILLRGVGL